MKPFNHRNKTLNLTHTLDSSQRPNSHIIYPLKRHSPSLYNKVGNGSKLFPFTWKIAWLTNRIKQILRIIHCTIRNWVKTQRRTNRSISSGKKQPLGHPKCEMKSWWSTSKKYQKKGRNCSGKCKQQQMSIKVNWDAAKSSGKRERPRVAVGFTETGLWVRVRRLVGRRIKLEGALRGNIWRVTICSSHCFTFCEKPTRRNGQSWKSLGASLLETSLITN